MVCTAKYFNWSKNYTKGFLTFLLYQERLKQLWINKGWISALWLISNRFLCTFQSIVEFKRAFLFLCGTSGLTNMLHVFMLTFITVSVSRSSLEENTLLVYQRTNTWLSKEDRMATASLQLQATAAKRHNHRQMKAVFCCCCCCCFFTKSDESWFLLWLLDGRIIIWCTQNKSRYTSGFPA